jgi:hypothetical protein
MNTVPNLFGENEGKLTLERVVPVAAKDNDGSKVIGIVDWLVAMGRYGQEFQL